MAKVRMRVGTSYGGVSYAAWGEYDVQGDVAERWVKNDIAELIGGVSPASDSQMREALKSQAAALGIEFPQNIKTEKLAELITEARRRQESGAAGGPGDYGYGR